MSRQKQQRLPLEPLLELTGGNMSELARKTGVDARQLHRDREDGVTVRRADQMATALQLHAAIIWPEWNQIEATDDGLVECAAPDCSDRFAARPRQGGPLRRWCCHSCRTRTRSREARPDYFCEGCNTRLDVGRVKWCSDGCKSRTFQRRRRSDPEWVESERQRMVRYKAEVAQIKARRNHLPTEIVERSPRSSPTCPQGVYGTVSHNDVTNERRSA